MSDHHPAPAGVTRRGLFSVLQLRPGHDLLQEIERFVEREGIAFAAIVTGVGSLRVANIRPAVPDGGQANPIVLERELEIVSISGMLTATGRLNSHVHLAVSDTEGHMTGGHLQSGSIIRLGAKVVIGAVDPDVDESTDT